MVGASTDSGHWLLRELPEPAEVQQAVEDVAAWGFPRPVEQYEIDLGSWFRMGRGVVFWFEPPLEHAPGAAIVHLAVAPRYRSRWPVRRWDMAAQIIAELMGATHLLAQVDDCQTHGYAIRLGWREDGPRLFRLLGGATCAASSDDCAPADRLRDQRQGARDRGV